MENTTIKVSKSTAERLHRIVGELAILEGKRTTLEDAILYLLEKLEAIDSDEKDFPPKIEKDRKAILALMEQKFYGIEPEDFKEYDFDNKGG